MAAWSQSSAWGFDLICLFCDPYSPDQQPFTFHAWSKPWQNSTEIQIGFKDFILYSSMHFNLKWLTESESYTWFILNYYKEPKTIQFDTPSVYCIFVYLSSVSSIRPTYKLKNWLEWSLIFQSRLSFIKLTVVCNDRVCTNKLEHAFMCFLWMKPSVSLGVCVVGV